MFLTMVGAFVGAVLSVLFVVYLEYTRKPKLRLVIETPPTDADYADKPARHARFVRVRLQNLPMRKAFRWLGRSGAMQCHGDVQFCHFEDGGPIFARPMPIRWAGDDPISYHVANGQIVPLFDPAKYQAAFYRDVYPGESRPIDVAGRFDDESECYGWSNETYLPNRGWRNPDWKLPRGRYLVIVTVYSAGDECSGVFQLENSVGIKDFRLLEASSEDIYKVKPK
jgi:hypothetical protein